MSLLRDTLRSRLERLRRLPRDESGTISIVSVFCLLMFTTLLVMVVNVSRHLDDKLRLQNAADAATYSGATVMARGMNTLAFANHLLCETFALTAYMREAQARSAESLVPAVLDEWAAIGPVFRVHGASSGFRKFADLGAAIEEKVPLERELVSAWGDMSYYHAALTLPVLEHILRGDTADGDPGTPPQQSPDGGLIPRFQRLVVRTTPAMAHLAAREIARRYVGRQLASHGNAGIEALLWRTDVLAAGQGTDETDPLNRTLPALDPSPMGPDGPPGNFAYLDEARALREQAARRYLEAWTTDWMSPYFGFPQPANGNHPVGRLAAKMSQYVNFWRTTTGERLTKLLDDEYVDTNVPHAMTFEARPEGGPQGTDPGRDNPKHERWFRFVGVSYWEHVEETFPGVFRNPLQSTGSGDSLAFAQAAVFVPRRRFLNNGGWTHVIACGGDPRRCVCAIHQDDWPHGWDLMNQNWTSQLVPANVDSLPAILSQRPPTAPWIAPPNLANVGLPDIDAVNHH